DNGSTLFSVSETQITSALPHQFTAAGDVSIAYDLVLTNQTASYIDSFGPLTIRSGEPFESNNLTLKTYNGGNIILDPGYWGKVAVGTGSAALKFHVMDHQGATASAIIENTWTGANSTGLLVKLGGTTNLTTSNSFIKFLRGDGLSIGKIIAVNATTVGYSADGVDMAEYFTKDSSQFVPGDVVVLGTDGATKSFTTYDSKMIGVVSAAPGFLGGVEGPDKVLVGIVGQVPVKVDPASAPITPGDHITSSGNPGMAVKADRPGFTLGKALGSWNPGQGQETVMVFLNIAWADPNQSLAFDESGNMTINGQLTAKEIVARPVSSEPEIKLTDLQTSIENLESQIASISAQLASLTPQASSSSAAVIPDDLSIISLNVATDAVVEGQLKVWGKSLLADTEIAGDATVSGKLIVTGQTLLSDTVIAGDLFVGTLKFDDMLSDISSLTGLLSFNNGVAVMDEYGNFSTAGTVTAKEVATEKLTILGASDVTADTIGKVVLAAGLTELTVDTTAVSTASAIFVTPETPVAAAASATDSGRFTIRIPTPLPNDLKVNWWVIN
ncbi:MAG: Peptidase S8/S53, partial [Candidatus Amesbacteria bacterium GW2011_GWC1_47_15]